MPDDFAQDGQFCRLRRGEDVDLVGLLLEFAGDATPGIDTLACLAEIERLGRAAQRRLAARSLTPGGKSGLTEISRVLYDVEGFEGNREDYYDPRNSLLDAVLSRRRGLPITLGILYIAVAERAKAEGFTAIAGAMPASQVYRDSVRAGLVALAGEGRLVVPVARTFPLADALDATELLMSQHPGGKLVLEP